MTPIKVLFLSATPPAADALRTDRELRDVIAAVRQAAGADALSVDAVLAVRQTDLQDVLLQHTPHVVHFAGHAAEGGAGLLMDSGAVVTTEALVNLLRAVGGVRVVVLNACHTREMAQALTGVVDYAVGMNETIGDVSAKTFARAFYRTLAYGRSVENAFQLGMSELDLNNRPSHMVPCLFTRAGELPPLREPLPAEPVSAAPTAPRQKIRIGNATAGDMTFRSEGGSVHGTEPRQDIGIDEARVRNEMLFDDRG